MAKKNLKFKKNEKIEDTVKIEEIAVGYINTLINESTTKLKSEILLNDRGVSFDGSIILTKGNYTVENYIGKIPVQIKGKQLYSSSGFPKKFKYNIDKNQYQNYYSEGGVLFIVVGIVFNPETKKYQKRLYIDSILRLKAKTLISSIPPFEESISTTVYEINDNELEKVCFDFFENFDKQPRMIEVGELSIPRNGMLTETYISKKQSFLNKEFYISTGEKSTYAGYATPIKFRKGYDKLLFNVGNQEFRMFVSFEGSKLKRGRGAVEEHKIIIEELIEMTIDGNQKFEINKMKYKSIEYQLRVLPFLKKIYEEKQLKINNKYQVDFSDLETDGEEVERINNTIGLFKKTKVLLEEFHITKLNDESDYKQIIRDFSILKEILLDREYSGLKDFDDTFSHMVKINLQTMSFLAFYDKDDNSFEYPFSDNLLDQKIVISDTADLGNISDEETFPSIYITLTNFSNISNIDYSTILRSFDTKEEIGEIGHQTIIFYLLERIKEFDLTHDDNILNFCIDLCKLILSKLDPSNNSYSTYVINFYQCIRRTRKLETSEVFELAKLDINKNIEQEKLACFCIHVITENFVEAQKLIDDIENIEEYPIYSLYNLLLSENTNQINIDN
ncbi:hypothetical protein [Marinilactibacillus psychrotolerans]|uniref:hypothetical protein n=1 Tax=Marinilactibacillus psychrotolerans TaxID=191770 RepID=UPI00380A5E19